MRRAAFLAIYLVSVAACAEVLQGKSAKELMPYKNPRLSIEERVNDLVARMTMEEKISQMVNDAAAIERLDVPRYNWWNECLHGVARAGLATFFPQAIGLAATWDTDLMHRVATATSDEARAKHHEFARREKRGIYQGLTFWSPNINIFRDPRWGRGMETYGEDPYLTGKLAIEFIRGLQGKDRRYLKAVATAKHYAVHSGPEPDRHTFNAVVDERDLRETYLPHFEASIREAHAFSVMCAYNRLYGEACCGSPLLLLKILREEWGFNGYVVSDCGAVSDIYRTHKIVATSPEAAALAVKSGCDIECGNVYKSLKEAVEKGLITEKEIDTAVERLFAARFKLGMFDPPRMVPYAKIPYRIVDSEAHRRLALEAARESVVLLKNDHTVLPLRKDLGTIAVIGPNADDVEILLGNYNGTPSRPITPLQGIREKVSKNTRVLYAQGCEWAENLPSFEVVSASALFTTDGGNRINGLEGEYFDNRELKGNPVLTRIDRQIDFNWWEGTPDKRITDDDNFGVRWTGELAPPVSGAYALGGYGLMGPIVCLGFLLSLVSVHANCYPHTPESYLQASAQDMQWWRDAKFGLFIHWGPVSLKGTEIGWSRGGERRGRKGTGEIPVEEYDNLFRRFNPTRFDADQWVKIAQTSGMKYLVFTTKHHDGFCMFDTRLSDYKITHPDSPFHRDVVAELSRACHKAGIKLGFYYSPVDWHHPDYRTENHPRYIQYMHGHLRELCSNYGRVDVIWFDGLQLPMGGKASTYLSSWAETWDSHNLFQMIRRLQPHVLVNNRAGLPADFDTPEQQIGTFQPDRAWESCITIGKQWAWKPNDELKSYQECLRILIQTVGGDGNLLLNVGPMPTGEIEPRQVEHLTGVGKWLRKYGDTLYRTRGGPFKPQPWGVSTYRGNNIFVHVLNWGGKDTLTLPSVDRKVIKSSVVTGGKVSIKQSPQQIDIQVPTANHREVDTIIVLTLDGPAAGISPR